MSMATVDFHLTLGSVSRLPQVRTPTGVLRRRFESAHIMSSTAPSTNESQSQQGESLIQMIKNTKVSSVLNDSREYGKQNLYDGSHETCWNSAQGTPQFIQISFQHPCQVKAIRLTFQGGFVGKTMQVSVTNQASPKKFLLVQSYEPRDINTMQQFDLPSTTSSATADAAVSVSDVTNLKITFPSSTDFYGRITIYSLDILGQPTPKETTNGQPTKETTTTH